MVHFKAIHFMLREFYLNEGERAIIWKRLHTAFEYERESSYHCEQLKFRVRKPVAAYMSNYSILTK